MSDAQRPQTFEDWNRLFLLRQGTFTREQVEFERGEAWRCATASRDAEIAALKEQLRLERVAVVLRASGLVPSCGNGYACKAMNPKFSTYCPNCKLKDAISALLSDSDKSFAEAHVAEVMLKAAALVCDYCGGRAFQSKGPETPFQYAAPDDNWYHRVTSPCKAAAIHRALKRGLK